MGIAALHPFYILKLPLLPGEGWGEVVKHAILSPQPGLLPGGRRNFSLKSIIRVTVMNTFTVSALHPSYV